MKPMNTLNGYEIADKEVRARITELEAAVEEIKANGGGTVDTSGTAMASDILEGQTAWVNGVKLEGTMPNHGKSSPVDIEIAPGSLRTIEQGYHSGMETLSVKSMEELTPASATAEDILTGKSAWVNGELLDGTLELNGGAIANGFTVNFYDAENNLVQSEMAIYGYEIYAPASHMVDHWEDVDGNIVQFPLTVAADSGIDEYNVYESGPSTCERVIYNHFGISKLDYTKLLVSYRNGTVTVYFSNAAWSVSSDRKKFSLNATALKAPNIYSASNNMTDITKAILSWTGSLVDTASGSAENTSIYSDGCRIYTNFDIVAIDGRLDETIYDDGSQTLIHPYSLQEKTVNMAGEVTPDEGYYGLSKVIVESPIDNSFTVNFHDNEGNLFESHTTTCGMNVVPPASFTAVGWKDADGNTVEFPFTSSVESVYDFEAVVS